MTTSPFDYSPSPGLWMGVTDLFHIKGRGTVITGRLEGEGQLKVGDIAVCGDMRWQVSGIEQFGARLMTAEPGLDIGVLFRESPPRDMVRNRTVQFESRSGGVTNPQFTVLDPKKRRWRR